MEYKYFFKSSHGIAQFYMLLNSRLNDFNPPLLFKTYRNLASVGAWRWFSECNIEVCVCVCICMRVCVYVFVAIPQQWHCKSVDIAYLVVDADYPATDKVNSRKQPLSPKSSIAVRLLCYLKNRFELHCNLW